MPTITETMEVLVSGTPLSLDLLKTGWLHFSFGEKVEILSVLLPSERNERRSLRWGHQIGLILDLALADENPLVRRLAAKHVSKPSEHTALEKRQAEEARYGKVQSDPFDCVREYWNEATWGQVVGYRKDADLYQWFWDKHQYQRLTFVHGMNDGEWIAGAITFALVNHIPAETVSTFDLIDVLIQFFTWRDFGRRAADMLESSKDGWSAYSAEKDLQALWALVPNVDLRIRAVLLTYLPEEGCTQEALDALSESEVIHLLDRADFDVSTRPVVRPRYLRRGTKWVRGAALSSRTFRLRDNDLSEFMPLPGDDEKIRFEKLEMLNTLAESYRGGTLAQLAAIRETRNICWKEWSKTSREDVYPQEGRFIVGRVKRCTYSQLKSEVFDLRTFYFAWAASTSDNAKEWISRFTQELTKKTPLDEKVGWLKWITEFRECIVKDDPWSTFLRFKKALASSFFHYWMTRCLPPIGEFGTEFECIPIHLRGIKQEEDRESPIDLVAEADRIMDTLPESDRAVLGAMTGALTILHGEIVLTNTRVQTLTDRLDRFASNIKTLIWLGLIVVTAIFVFRLFR